jgi:benzylsuccinate CoA-transferase BbsE subunit
MVQQARADGGTGPLADVTILDLAGEAGVFAGRVLADLGADVIRIEQPGGDAVRCRGPFLHDRPGGERSLYHLHFNANKRGITLDIHSGEGAKVFRRLAACADAVIETAPPGEMDSIGLGYESLRSINPGLLYVTITPFGQQGPMREYRGNDLVGAAMSGLMYLNGQSQEPPNQPGAEQAYHMASLAAASGLLVALYGRNRREGRLGHRIDVSIQEAATMATLQSANANMYTWYKRIPARRGLGILGRHLFKCADGLWISFVIMPYRWDDFVRWLKDEGIESEVEGEEWRDQGYRTRNNGPVAKAMEALAARHTRDEMFHQGQKRLMSVMPVNEVSDLVNDPQFRERDFFASFNHPESEAPLVDTGPVAKMSATPLRLWGPAPRPGEHNQEVYAALLGMSTDDIMHLQEQGVI